MSPSLLSLSAPLENVSPQDVVIGRGRRIREHPGNVRFQAIVQENLSGYANALTKTKKSLIILKILNTVRAHQDANFVKLDSKGVPFTVEESQARITIAQSLRDCLNPHYKSSRQHKQRKRLQIKRATAAAHYISTRTAQASSSTTLQTSLALLHQTVTSAPFPAMTMTTPIQPLDFPSFNDRSESDSNRLKDILDEAVGLATKQEQEQEQQQDDVFTSLFKAFAPSEATATATLASPFEPTPVLEPTPLPQEEGAEEASYGSLQDDWEPFPLFS